MAWSPTRVSPAPCSASLTGELAKAGQNTLTADGPLPGATAHRGPGHPRRQFRSPADRALLASHSCAARAPEVRGLRRRSSGPRGRRHHGNADLHPRTGGRPAPARGHPHRLRSRSPLATVRPGSPASTPWSLRVQMIRSTGVARVPSAMVTAGPAETMPRAIRSSRMRRFSSRR